MKTSDFYYDLPQELIAQTPLLNRQKSRMMVLDRKKNGVEHKIFENIVDYINSGDTLVLNDTKVIPARLFGHRVGKEEKIEILLLKQIENDRWQTLVKPGKKCKIGEIIEFSNKLKLEVIDILEDGQRVVEFKYEGIFNEILDELGTMPLPPYIHEKLEDQSRYQTVYAKEVGSAAAPTAGLHFTKDLLSKIRNKGINIVYITLHVGLGTFRPVSADNVEEHEMHSEFYTMSSDVAEVLEKTRKNKKRIIAVGTTSTRTLETIMGLYNEFRACSGWTNIFIYPGYKFKAIDALITNFHLPKSTLVMLVSTLAGRENILNAYNVAVSEKYRFFSFGDAMFIK